MQGTEAAVAYQTWRDIDHENNPGDIIVDHDM